MYVIVSRVNIRIHMCHFYLPIDKNNETKFKKCLCKYDYHKNGFSYTGLLSTDFISMYTTQVDEGKISNKFKAQIIT